MSVTIVEINNQADQLLSRLTANSETQTIAIETAKFLGFVGYTADEIAQINQAMLDLQAWLRDNPATGA